MSIIQSCINVAILAASLASCCRTTVPSSPLIGTWQSVRIDGPDSDTVIEQTLSFSENGSLALVDRNKATCDPTNDARCVTRAWATPYETRGTDIVRVLDVDFTYQTQPAQRRDGSPVLLLHLTATTGSNVWQKTYRKLEWTGGRQHSVGDVADRITPEK